MPYEPTNWKSGDVVTSAKLNKIEGGISSGGVLVVTDTSRTLDKTWQEIYDAGFAVLHIENSVAVLCYTNSNPSRGEYELTFFDGTDRYNYTAISADAYPEIVD